MKRRYKKAARSFPTAAKPRLREGHVTRALGVGLQGCDEGIKIGMWRSCPDITGKAFGTHIPCLNISWKRKPTGSGKPLQVTRTL